MQNQMFLMNCPFPINGGVASNTNIDGLTVTYDLVRDNSTEDYHLTIFTCEIVDPNIPLYQASTEVLTTTNDWFNVGQSYLAYLMHSIFAFFSKMQALFTLIGFFVTPTNFNILGYTIADLAGIPLMIVVAAYALCYIFIGVWLYKVASPFSGGN